MGDAADIVNAGVTVIKLLANHADVEVVQGGYANAFPSGFTGADLAGGAHKKVSLPYKVDSEWYEFLTVNMDFTVHMKWMHGATLHGKGKYVDNVTVTMDVKYLPLDQTVDVTAHFPTHGHNYGSQDDVNAGIPFTIVIQMNYFLGQLVGWRRSLDCVVRGDGTWEMA